MLVFDNIHNCRYMLLLNVPGKGEEAMLNGVMFDGIQTKEAAEVEGPMFEQLGMQEAMKKPGAMTAAINWYRWAFDWKWKWKK